MLTLTLGGFLQGFLATVFVVLCLLLCLIIVIQKPRGGGLSGAFGGAGGGTQMWGGKSGDILTWITVAFFVGFLVIGMGLVVVTRNEARANQTVVEPTLENPEGGAADLPLELPPLPPADAGPARPDVEAPAPAPTPAPSTEPAPTPPPPSDAPKP